MAIKRKTAGKTPKKMGRPPKVGTGAAFLASKEGRKAVKMSVIAPKTHKIASKRPGIASKQPKAASTGKNVAMARQTGDIDPYRQNYNLFSGGTTAGVLVTPENAYTVSTVWACVRYLSQTTASLPWHVFRYSGDKKSELRDHPATYLLNRRANPELSAFQFRETLINWALRYGNGFAELERNVGGQIIGMWPIHPNRVTVCRNPDTGALFYEVDNGAAARSVIPSEDMFHVRGFGDGPVGVSVVEAAAEAIGWAKAMQLFGASYFGNGMSLSGVVTMKKELDMKGLKKLKDEFQSMFQGPKRSRRVAFLDSSMDWKPVSATANDGQFIETNQYMVEEIARWFGVPPHKIGYLLKMTYNSVEQQSIEAVQDCHVPWIKRFEDEADYKFFGRSRPNLYTKMNLRGMLRGDFKSQNEGLEIARHNGIINADEWREYLDMNPMNTEAGHKYTMQSQYTTLDRIGEAVPDPVPVSAPSEPSQPSAPEPSGDQLSAAVIEDIASMTVQLKGCVSNVD